MNTFCPTENSEQPSPTTPENPSSKPDIFVKSEINLESSKDELEKKAEKEAKAEEAAAFNNNNNGESTATEDDNEDEERDALKGRMMNHGSGNVMKSAYLIPRFPYRL